jgi:hypothetical protein
MIQAKRSFVKCRDWFIGISHFELCIRVSSFIRVVEQRKGSREISENKIAVCDKMQGLRSGNFSDLNSACSTVLVPIKIFQFQDMHYENRFLGTFQGHSKRPKCNTIDLPLNLSYILLKWSPKL